MRSRAWQADNGQGVRGLRHCCEWPGAAKVEDEGLGDWTVNAEPDMRRMIELGVDILMTERPDLGRRLMGR